MEETTINNQTSSSEATKICPNCGGVIAASAVKCRHCGQWLKKKCPYCREEVLASAVKCRYCGEWLGEKPTEHRNNSTASILSASKAVGYSTQQTNEVPHHDQQTIIVNPTPTSHSNGLGTSGFVLAILGLLLGWIPVLGWILWFLGVVLSFAGIFKRPKGLAIAELCISLIGLIILIAVGGAVVAALDALSSIE